MLKIGLESCDCGVPHFHFGKENGKVWSEIHMVFIEDSKYRGDLVIEDMEEYFENIYTHEFLHQIMFDMFDRTICKKCIGCNKIKECDTSHFVTSLLHNICEYSSVLTSDCGGIKIPDFLPRRKGKGLLGSVIKWFTGIRNVKT